jgi:hypothetical protein
MRKIYAARPKSRLIIRPGEPDVLVLRERDAMSRSGQQSNPTGTKTHRLWNFPNASRRRCGRKDGCDEDRKSKALGDDKMHKRRPPTLQRQLDDFRREAHNGKIHVDGITVHVFEDEDTFDVQIELGAKHTIVLTYWKDTGRYRQAPSVSLWRGSGSHDYGGDSLDSFREWVGRALEFITAPYGACVDCEFDTFAGREYYTVNDTVWEAASKASPPLPGGRGLLCIGCLERRLGRELTCADFPSDNPLNQRGDSLSDRIRNRLQRT